MSSESLFRLMLKRPAVAQDPENPSIRLAQESSLQIALAEAQDSENPRDEMKRIAHNFTRGPSFVGDPTILYFYPQIKKLSESLDVLEKKANVTNGELVSAVQDAFGESPSALVSSNAFGDSIMMLSDSIIAIKLLPEEHHRRIEDITNQVRNLEVILKVVADVNFPGSGEKLRRYRRRSLMLPTETELHSTHSDADRQKEIEKMRKEQEEKTRKQGEAKLELYNMLKVAIRELTSLNGEHFQSTPQQADAGFLLPVAFRPTQIFIQDMLERQQLSPLNLLRAQAPLGKGDTSGRIEEKSLSGLVQSVGSAVVSNTQPDRLISGSPPFKPLLAGEATFRLKPSAERLLSNNTIEILKQRGINIGERPLDQIVETLRGNVVEVGEELDELFGRPMQHTFKRLGSTLVMISTPIATPWNNLVFGKSFLPAPTVMKGTRVPQSHGSVVPSGVADLLVVKQQLIRYEGADVAHIENVLKGEKKLREHTRRRETEEITFRETEITTSEERELETTTRFEMSRETSDTIKEDASLKAGLTLTGKYGPTVEFSASAEGSLSRSKEEARKTAATFSQDVTERSSNKVTERILERSSLRVTNEVIDKNTHQLSNTIGTGHISGVYQWVSKVFQAQMFNYGIRTMFDFMVPEPGAFLIAALQGAHANAVELEKPIPFTLRPDQIDEWKYHVWIKEYGATDVSPPPEEYKTKSIDFKAGGGEANIGYNHSAQVPIEDGYKAVHGTVGKLINIWDDSAVVDVVLGSRIHRFIPGDWVWRTPLDEERDSIPFALNTFQVAQVAAVVEVKCARTDRAMMKWRHDTHAKLTQAYKARLAEYEEKLASLEMQAGVAIRGKNPALNLELMKDELKKNCISIMTEQHFDEFDAITTGPNGLPQIDLFENAALGPYVRFFEQAFEWEHMTWVTYPYFWGSKDQWAERIGYEDVDPLFNEFLKAGYCRVVVPARPGFEGAIDHFMTYGEAWNGGPLPPISSPLYLPIADEIAERLDRPGDEIPEGDHWLVRIPTTLIHLRADDKLPSWIQNDDGDWVEA